MDYKNGKIYRIVCNETGLCYVGSTTQTLTKRLSKHKSNFKLYLKEKRHYITSYKIIENNNYDIVLLEEVYCENKDQLHRRERYYIETMDCVNKNIPSRTKEEYGKKWREENSDKIKENRDLHKDEKKEYDKEYHDLHKDEKKEYDKEYREKNKEKIKEYKKNYYKKNNNKSQKIAY